MVCRAFSSEMEVCRSFPAWLMLQIVPDPNLGVHIKDVLANNVDEWLCLAASLCCFNACLARSCGCSAAALAASFPGSSLRASASFSRVPQTLGISLPDCGGLVLSTLLALGSVGCFLSRCSKIGIVRSTMPHGVLRQSSTDSFTAKA